MKEHPFALTGPITPSEGQPSKLNLITDTELAKAGIIYVVMDKHRTTVLQTPGTNKPFFTKKKKYADQIARESGGVVETYREAIRYVASSPCNLPKDHKHYNPDPSVAKIPI